MGKVPTLLSLYRFAQIVGLHPLHFMQVDANIGTAESRVCIEPIFEMTWQHSDAISREELALAIYEAEREIADQLGYWPLPRWEIQERELVDQSYMIGTYYNGLRAIDGDLVKIKTDYGRLISGGIRAKTLIQAAGAIVYTDVDSDGYFETATITTPTSVTAPDEIHIYYPGLSGDDEWEIKPINVTIAAGVATITCRREQLVIKTLLEALDAQTVSGGTNANFLTIIDVYRVYHDPSQQIQLVWRNSINSCVCNGVGCENCSLTIQNACMNIVDHRLGLITISPGEWDADTETFSTTQLSVCRRPDYVRMWYRAGYKDEHLALPNIQLAREWEIAIAKLAVTKLDRPICSCRSVQQIIERWSINLRASVSTQARSNSYRVTDYELENNPFGSSIGAMDVWRLVRKHSLGVINEVY